MHSRWENGSRISGCHQQYQVWSSYNRQPNSACFPGDSQSQGRGGTSSARWGRAQERKAQVKTSGDGMIEKMMIYIWGFPRMVVPNNQGFPTKHDHFGVFRGTTILGNTHIYIYKIHIYIYIHTPRTQLTGWPVCWGLNLPFWWVISSKRRVIGVLGR